MLDPWELADPGGADDPPAATVDELAEVTHHGHRAWQALLRPTEHYAPRCSCCALLPSPQSDARQARAGGPLPHWAAPGFSYADAHRVRLDVGTGMCVFREQVGGSADGAGHDLAIEAVNEDMADSLFHAGRHKLRHR